MFKLQHRFNNNLIKFFAVFLGNFKSYQYTVLYCIFLIYCRSQLLNKKAELMLKIFTTAVCNLCMHSEYDYHCCITVVSCESRQNAPTVLYLSLSLRTHPMQKGVSSQLLDASEPLARKNADNPLICGLGSFKVTDFGTNRKLVVDFL